MMDIRPDFFHYMRMKEAKQTVLLFLILGLAGFALVQRGIFATGIGWDEPYYIVSGMQYISGTLEGKPIDKVWQSNHEHPPLAKLTYGLPALLAQAYSNDTYSYDIVSCARLASWCWFWLLCVMVYACGKELFGQKAGVFAALTLFCMPRVLAHAHLAALDLPMAAAWMAVVWSYLRLETNWRRIVIFGLAVGAAFLIKINGFGLIGGLVIVQCITRKAPFRAFAIGLGMGCCVFFAGWPWLWPHPITRTVALFSTVTKRAVVDSFFMGKAYRETFAPFYYPTIMTLITLPVPVLGIMVAGFVQSWKKIREHDRKVLCTILLGAWTLVLASLPGMPRYDGVRLFLGLFPILAVFAGAGWVWLRDVLIRRIGKEKAVLMIGLLFLAGATPGWLYRPFGLSYYNLLVGGLTGANHLGFEVTYWGEGLDGELLGEVFNQGRRNPPQVSYHHVEPLVLQLHKGYDRIPMMSTPRMSMSRTRASQRYRILVNRRGALTDDEQREMEAGSYIYARTLWGVPLVAVFSDAQP